MESIPELLQPLAGLAVFTAVAWLLSENRGEFSWIVVLVGLGLQVAVALAMFRIEFIQSVLILLNSGVAAVSAATEAGTIAVFGYLGGDPASVGYPFRVEDPGATYIIAFRVLPLILFFTVLSAILWYYRILPLVIHGFSLALRRSMGVSGPVGVSAAANIFLGMVEAPLLVRPYLSRLNRSELFIVMTCGMATVSGAVLILYSVVLDSVITNALGHILTASVISAPAAIMIAVIMVPGFSQNDLPEIFEDPVHYHGVMDAITRGTADGIRFTVNVGAMLMVLLALVALVNTGLSALPDAAGSPITLQRIFGVVFAPVVWLMGVPWHESAIAGSLMGTKTVLSEFIAFLSMAELGPDGLSERTRLIMTYALCGFANFGSLGIMVAGLGTMCPERREEIARLAPKSLLSGTLATCMTGSIAALFA